MTISSTSTAHTIASIEPYERGQDRSEPEVLPCMVLAVCCDFPRHLSDYSTQRNHTRLRRQPATEMQRRLCRLRQSLALACLKATAHIQAKRIEPRSDEGTLTMRVVM